jgi:hypothetical protein
MFDCCTEYVLILRWGKNMSLVLRPLTGPLPILQVIYECVGALVEWYWQGKPKDLERNPSHCRFVRYKSHVYCPRSGLRCQKPHVLWHGLHWVFVACVRVFVTCMGFCLVVCEWYLEKLVYSRVRVIIASGSQTLYLAPPPPLNFFHELHATPYRNKLK